MRGRSLECELPPASPTTSVLLPSKMFVTLPALIGFATTFVTPSLASTQSFNQAKPYGHNYRQPHSYAGNYQFAQRDGWQSVAVTDLPYKYNVRAGPEVSKNITEPIAKPVSRSNPHRKRRTHGKRCDAPVRQEYQPEARPAEYQPEAKPEVGEPSALPAEINNAVGRMSPTGTPQDVTITWYTGEDLLNPSCWSHPDWAPSDESFACALTLEGWVEKPECFKFLELCNGASTCIFVRIVDSCAGCQKGSRHVDLTKAAFSKLASLDVGKLTVQMRLATEPSIWDHGLWGPQI